MILRMSSMFLRTLREDPADAEVPSHRLLVRAGYLRRVSPGIYTWLPLGKRLLDRVTAVIKAEMDTAGGQELLFPALLPREVYERSGRAANYGDDLFRLTDRRGAPHVLGPTHEEMFALQVKAECSSHRDLPVLLYQVQTKYRDEQRPRAGALRGREFLMKDAYSFDLDKAGMARSYARMREAYRRIFDRLGLEYRIVAALPGAMGGSHTEEFLATSPVGEDTFVSCTGCDYAANVEALRIRPPEPGDPAGHPPLTEVATPGAATVAAVAADLGVPTASVLKNLLVTLRPPGGKPEIVAVGVPGDREVDLRRLEAAVFPATVEMVTAEDFADRPDLVRGYVGPQGLTGVRYLADPRVAPGTAWVTGANRVDVHTRDVVVGRDFTVDGYVDAAEVREGDPCPRCGAALAAGRGIEIGQIFQLGRHFTNLFEVEVLGQDGTPVRPEMGCYGIGVTRAAAAVAEQTHDDAGLCWPASIAPADVHLVAAGRGDGPVEVAERVAGELAAAGLDVLYDDRTGVSAGVKFTDAELIGVPAIVVAGRRAGEGVVEVRDRRTGERRDVPIPELLTVLAR